MQQYKSYDQMTFIRVRRPSGLAPVHSCHDIWQGVTANFLHLPPLMNHVASPMASSWRTQGATPEPRPNSRRCLRPGEEGEV